jgi:hypothetical protein
MTDNHDFDNPYAAPDSSYEDVAATLMGSEGRLWRQGKLLVMERDAALPDRCVKSNEPCEGRLKRLLRWHHPAIYLVILANILIYAIVASLVSHRATIHIGLSDEWQRRRRRNIAIGWLTALVGIGLMCSLGFADETALPFLLISGIVLVFGGLLFGMYGSRMVSPKKIDRTHIWLRGVHPDFLASLPEWHGG